MSKLNNILALLPDNVTKKIKPVDLRTSVEYIYEDMMLNTQDSILTLGPVTPTTNTLNVSVHLSGINSVRMSGVIWSKSTPDTFLFSPVTAGKLKYIILYALADSQIFYIAEGTEGTEAIFPDIPAGSLFVKSILISEFGALVEDSDDGYKLLAEDPWRNIVINNNTPTIVVIAGSPSSSFNLLVGSGSTDPKIGGIRTKVQKNTRDGHEITFYNDSATAITFIAGGYSETPAATSFGFKTEFVLSPGKFQKFKRKNNLYEVLPSGSDPDLSGYALQSDLDSEEYNRALEDFILDAKITTEKNRNDTQDLEIAKKVDKPITDGTWMLKKIGSVFTWVAGVVENISNTDLTNISARIFTQGNTFTWNTAGFFHYLKGLLDKTGNASYTKVVVVHPTTGETVTRDFADPANTTLAIENTNSTQLTSIRTKLFGATTPASPVLTSAVPNFIIRNSYAYIDLFGINLTLIDPTSIWIEKSDTTKIYAESFFNKASNFVTTVWKLPADLPVGQYPIRIQISSVPQGISTAILNVVNNTAAINFPAGDWSFHARKSGGIEVTPVVNSNYALNNFVRVSLRQVPGYIQGVNNVSIIFKSKNILLGSDDFELVLNVTLVQTTQTTQALMPFIGLTHTTDSWSQVEDIVYSSFLSESYNVIGYAGNTITLIPAPSITIYMSKIDNKVFYRVVREYGSSFTVLYYTQTIDVSKNYALFIQNSETNSPSYHTVREISISGVKKI